MKNFKAGDYAEYVGTMIGTIKLSPLKVKNVAQDQDLDTIEVEDPTGATWYVKDRELIRYESKEETAKAKVQELVDLKQGGFTVDEIIRLKDEGLWP
jgi:hypothetical protein